MVEQICRASTFSRNGFATLSTDDLQLLLICFFLNPNYFHIMEPLFLLFETISSPAAVSFSLRVSSMLVVLWGGGGGGNEASLHTARSERQSGRGRGRAHSLQGKRCRRLRGKLTILTHIDINDIVKSCIPVEIISIYRT